MQHGDGSMAIWCTQNTHLVTVELCALFTRPVIEHGPELLELCVAWWVAVSSAVANGSPARTLLGNKGVTDCGRRRDKPMHLHCRWCGTRAWTYLLLCYVNVMYGAVRVSTVTKMMQVWAGQAHERHRPFLKNLGHVAARVVVTADGTFPDRDWGTYVAPAS